jgi:tetratricopeptide (TPR) repeat protein
MARTHRLGVLILLISSCVFADDASTLLSKAEDHYQRREDQAELQTAIDDFQQVLQNDAENYQAAWRLSKAYWFQGNFSSGEKKPSFEKGIEAGKKAVQINPNQCEGHFWLGINYALLAESSGAFTALGLVDDIKREVNQAMDLDENCECGGPGRVLGKLYSKLPWFKGGSKKKAIALLKKSLDLCPQDTQSRIFLAEIYESEGQKMQALDLLRQVETIEPQPGWIPETKANKISAEKMIRDLQKSHGKD